METLLPISPKKLDINLYAVKRRTDIILTILEIRLEARPTRADAGFLINIYNSISGIQHLEYLTGDHPFPNSHYTINRARIPTLLKELREKVVDLTKQIDLYLAATKFPSNCSTDPKVRQVVREWKETMVFLMDNLQV